MPTVVWVPKLPFWSQESFRTQSLQWRVVQHCPSRQCLAGWTVLWIQPQQWLNPHWWYCEFRFCGCHGDSLMKCAHLDVLIQCYQRHCSVFVGMNLGIVTHSIVTRWKRLPAEGNWVPSGTLRFSGCWRDGPDSWCRVIGFLPKVLLELWISRNVLKCP